MLLSAFAACVVLAIVVPYALRSYYLNATVTQPGTLEIITGIVRITRQGATDDVAGNDGDPILEGLTLKTDGVSRALITLFEGSTIYMFENTELVVKSLRATRFTKSRTHIVLLERKGRLRIGVAPPTVKDPHFVIETPHCAVDLTDGSYAIEVGSDTTGISTRTGTATVTAMRTAVRVERGKRIAVLTGQPPSPPGPAALDLVLNGDFRQRDVGWTQKNDVEAGRRDDIYGRIEFLTTEPDGPAVRFVRRGSANSHGENSIHQDINRDVSDFVSLKLLLDFRLIYQSLSGGGYLGSEYPIMIHVTYRDESGNQWRWSRGFYYQNEAGYPTTYGEQMPGDVWIPYEKDLRALEGYPKPFRLLSLEIAASGWDYESMVKSVSILAE